MTLNDDAQVDTSQIEDRRGSGIGGTGIPLPGGIIGVVIVLLLAVGGGMALFDGGTGSDQNVSQCTKDNPDRLDDTDCRNALYVNSIQAYWRTALPRYQPAKTVFFSQAVSTGCGQAGSNVGPFYCPADSQVYIDLSFYDELARQFGADGQFAQAYVLAHEYGHHVQNLNGTAAQVQRSQERDPGNANKYSVLLELQADCFAGVWANHATKTTDSAGKPIFKQLTQRDLDEALEAAAAIGDDAIQKKMGGGVDESKFTHGTSAQRSQWLKTGYTSGNPNSCNTFA